MKVNARQEDSHSKLYSGSSFIPKARLDVNELVRQRKIEEKEDKKNNAILLSGAGAVVAVVVLILNL